MGTLPAHSAEHSAGHSSGPNAGLAWRTDALTTGSAHAIEDQWNELALNSSEKNIFAFPWFVIPSIPLLAPTKPRLVTIYDDELLIGLFLARSDMGYAKMPVTFMRTALHHEQFLGTPLVRCGFETLFAAGLCGWIDTNRADCCFLNLAMMTADDIISDAIAAYCLLDKRPLMQVSRFERASITSNMNIEKQGTLSAPDQSLSASRKKSLRRTRNSLSKRGDVTIERLSRDTNHEVDLHNWIQDFLRMENTGWKKEQGSSILSSATETHLYQKMIVSASHANALTFSRLCLDGKPISYTLDIGIPPDGYCVKSAIDQAYRKYSPGVLMEYETLKYYHQDGNFSRLDSCTAPDNELLNRLWPDRKPIMDLVIGRKGIFYNAVFKSIRSLKTTLGTVEGGRSDV